MKPKIGDIVSFAANPDKQGVVTALLERMNGHSYGVTWDDLTERWHTEGELVALTFEKPPIRIPV